MGFYKFKVLYLLLVQTGVFLNTLLDYNYPLQPPNITAIGQNSVLLHLDSFNASYNVIIFDLSNGSIVTDLTVFGNSNAYKLELVNPDPCHFYYVSMELNYYEKCTSGIATFETSEFEQFAFIINSYMYISQSHLKSTKKQ